MNQITTAITVYIYMQIVLETVTKQDRLVIPYTWTHYAIKFMTPSRSATLAGSLILAGTCLSHSPATPSNLFLSPSDLSPTFCSLPGIYSTENKSHYEQLWPTPSSAFFSFLNRAALLSVSVIPCICTRQPMFTHTRNNVSDFSFCRIFSFPSIWYFLLT